MNPKSNHPLETGLNDLEKRMFGPLLERSRKEYEHWAHHQQSHPSRAQHPKCIGFLKLRIGEEMLELDKSRRAYLQFTDALSALADPLDQKHLILQFARELGATPAELKKDEAAFARWFGADAVTDRYHRRQAQHEHYTVFLLGRLAAVASRVARTIRHPKGRRTFWMELQLEALIKPLLVQEGDTRLNLAAFRCLAEVLSGLGPRTPEVAVDDKTLQYIYRSALEHQQEVWIQCEALELLGKLSWKAFETVLQQRLRQPAGGDDIFVRRRAVELLSQHIQRVTCGTELVSSVLDDPSPFVRQALPKVALQAPAIVAVPWLQQLLLKDPSPKVRAAAWVDWPQLLLNPDLREMALQCIQELSRTETDEFVLRSACRSAERATGLLVSRKDPFLVRWRAAMETTLLHLRCKATSLKVRRWASQTYEFIWSECHPRARVLKGHFASFARSIPRGRSRRLPSALFENVDPLFVGRVWSVVCREDYDVQLQATRRGYKVIRGHPFGFRWWRWWHEFRHPSPDKRQAFPHTVGRLFDGQMLVPSSVMAELAQTTVPGEPLHVSSEGGWRPYLPLPDAMSSSIEFGRRPQPVTVFTSEGMTRVIPPQGWARWKAAARLTWRFRDYAEKRNWQESMQEPPSTYVNAFRRLGFDIQFYAYPDDTGKALPADPKVRRFFMSDTRGRARAEQNDMEPKPLTSELFPACASSAAGSFTPPILLATEWDRFQNYFVSLYQNSILELAVFTFAFALVFFSIHLFFNARLRRWRRRIPLVIGGWGTRGKSGTERLKAALFNAMGMGVVSKTTGCEAMFLHAHPFGQLKEISLFRPYDKATIWEQVNVVRLAGRLKTDVVLWECMGLTPSYVQILQRSWMQDDFATITNTYPDHEDLQGPAGINIPEVMGRFIPRNSTLITSEEQMLPVLASEADRVHTNLEAVTWLEAGLIPEDVLQRFPYEEHPYNIALVLRLAAQLGIKRDYALKEMADRVVADLGVLKTYPIATCQTRRLEFTNGMSANERYGALGNWSRMGFDRQDYLSDRGVWLTTVVNNRADRIPRSQVFAQLLVNDLSADRHVLIGGNLNGLLGYIREAWSEKAGKLSLWTDPARTEPAEALHVLEKEAVKMRLPFKPELIQAHLRIMLSAQPQVANVEELLRSWDQPEVLRSLLAPLHLGDLQTEILDTLQAELRIHNEYNEFAAQLREVNVDHAGSLNARFRELLQQWFQRKLIVVEDYYASGEQIIERIVRRTPPGFLNRIMGMQNIKGTGLDFIYRWQAWQACFDAAQPLRAGHSMLTPHSADPLAAFQDYGILCEEYVRDTIVSVQNSDRPQPPKLLQELEGILNRLEASLDAIREKNQTSQSSGQGWLSRCVMRIEEFLDSGDAVRRRGKADQIYADLVQERISRDRAITELQALTQRQKGGWLLKSLGSWPLFQGNLRRKWAAKLRKGIQPNRSGESRIDTTPPRMSECAESR
jgi:poly-gamma-glutamate synthase PgsB/CapB